jgi:hypothetical protein
MTVRAVALAALLMCSVVSQTPTAPAPTGRGGAARTSPPARILNFTAQPESIQPGQTVVLSWATENPSGVTISPDLGRVAARGSRQVSPAATTTYTITVGGPNNAAVPNSVTVTVAGSSPIAAASAPTTKKDARMPDGRPDLSGVYGFAGVRGAVPPPLRPGAEKYRSFEGQTTFAAPPRSARTANRWEFRSPLALLTHFRLFRRRSSSL